MNVAWRFGVQCAIDQLNQAYLAEKEASFFAAQADKNDEAFNYELRARGYADAISELQQMLQIGLPRVETI